VVELSPEVAVLAFLVFVAHVVPGILFAVSEQTVEHFVEQTVSPVVRFA